MKTLPHWANLLPLLGATLAYYLGLGWLKAATRAAQRPVDFETYQPTSRDLRDYQASLPDEEWCEAHDHWFQPETECPGCREEWESTWALGEEPDELAAWHDACEAAAAEAEGDGWYLDLVRRAENGWNGSDGYREGGAL